jgi:hypothetical protein
VSIGMHSQVVAIPTNRGDGTYPALYCSPRAPTYKRYFCAGSEAFNLTA